MILEIIAWGSMPTLSAAFFWKAYSTARQPISRFETKPKPRPAPVEDAWAAYCRDAEQREAAIYRQCPSAFWLHPDGPLAIQPPRDCRHEWIEVQRIGEQSKDRCVKCGEDRLVKPQIMPRCPNCGTHGAVIVLAEHGGEANMWHCGACMVEFTRKGETRSSRKAREKVMAKERKAEMRRFELGLDTPHDAMRRQTEDFVGAWTQPPMVSGTVPYRPQHTMRIAPPPPLPCGCPIETPLWQEKRVGYVASKGRGTRSSRCSQCEAWWYPASNDPTGRRVGQGECVHYADGTMSEPYFPPARPTR